MRLTLLLPPLTIALAAPLGAQTPSVVDLSPTVPPTAPWPVFADATDAVSAAGSPFADPGSARGQAWVDVVGPDPGDPAGIGPPDGRLDLIQTNSNSPALPLNVAPGEIIVDAIGDVHRPCNVFRSEADGTYTDVAVQLVPESNDGFDALYPGGSPWGIAVADFDGDADLDIFYACGGFNTASPNLLLSADGDGTFTNVGSGLGLTEVQPSFDGLWLDHDLDGDLDLFVVNGHPDMAGYYTGPANTSSVDRLYRNDGGSFTEVGVAAGVALAGTGFSGSAADLDRDGLPDLLVCNFKQLNKLYYNNGDGTFEFMLPKDSPAGSISINDLNLDPTFPGTYEFINPPPIAGGLQGVLPILPVWSMPVATPDVNGDGWLDVTYSAWSFQMPDDNDGTALGAMFQPAEPARLFLNRGDRNGDGRGDGLFRDVSEESGMMHVGGCMGMVISDLNGDGFDDFFMGAGGPIPVEHAEEDYLFINEPSAWPANFQSDPDQPLGRAFYEVGAYAGTYINKLMAHGSNAGIAEDGRVDLLIGNGGPAQTNDGQPNLYLDNTGNSNGVPGAYVRVTLSDGSNPLAGLGARAELIRDNGSDGPRIVVGSRAPSRGFSSQNGGPVMLGTGGDDVAYVGARWPDGRRQGRILWPLEMGTENVAFTRPGTSVGIDITHNDDDNIWIGGSVVQHDAATVSGVLVLAVLIPGADDRLEFGTLTVVDPLLTLAQGGTWNAGFQLPGLDTGLYALIYLDLAGGAYLGESAAWHYAPEALPLAASAPPARDPASGPAAPANLFAARERIALTASHVEISDHVWPIEVDTRIALDGIGERELSPGFVLRWIDGLAWVDFEVDAPIPIAIDAQSITLFADLRTDCCDVTGKDVATRIEFLRTGSGSPEIDGQLIPFDAQ